MLPVRFHPAPPTDGPTHGRLPANGPTPPPPPAAPPSPPTNRLNLLLTCASWRDDTWADRLPHLLEPMGIHSVRARTGREAERTIRNIQVHIAVVDLGLPLDDPRSSNTSASEAGPRILELLRRLDAPPPTVVVKGNRPTRDEARHIAAALRCDAFAVVDRSAADADVELMLKIFQRCLARFYKDRWPTPPSLT